MFKFLIYIRKKLYIQPKWRILRVFTKVIHRKEIVGLKKDLEEQIKEAVSQHDVSFLKGQLEIINLLLEE